MEQARYTPSGKMGVLAIPAALVTGAVVAVVGGYVYQWAVFHMGVLAAYFALPIIVFACVIGLTTSLALTWGKARSVPAGAAMGVVAGLLALAFTHHLAYEWNTEAWARRAEKKLAAGAVEAMGKTNPEAGVAQAEVDAIRTMSVADYVRERVERGWKNGRSRERGVLVWAAWLLEALILCGLGGAIARSGAQMPFCENCDEHARERKIGLIRGLDPVAVIGAAKKRGIPGVLALEPGTGVATVVVTLYACTHCTRTKFVSVTADWVRRRRIERPSARATKTVLREVIPSPADLSALAERFPESRRPSPRP